MAFCTCGGVIKGRGGGVARTFRALERCTPKRWPFRPLIDPFAARGTPKLCLPAAAFDPEVAGVGCGRAGPRILIPAP
eukprot:361458-Chlamydomonas_euryale.AAC.3